MPLCRGRRVLRLVPDHQGSFRMSRPQRRPNKAITQEEQRQAVMRLLMQREAMPDERMIESIARSYGVHVDLVRSMAASEDLRRRMRAC